MKKYEELPVVILRHSLEKCPSSPHLKHAFGFLVRSPQKINQFMKLLPTLLCMQAI